MADFLKGTCSVTNGSNTVTLNGGINAINVSNGTAIFIDGASPVQCLSGTVGSITLFEVWNGSDLTNVPFTTMNTIEGLDTAISRARSSADDLVAAKTEYDDLVASFPIPVSSGGTGAEDAPTALVNLGFTKTATELNTSVDDVNSLKDISPAMREVEWESQSEQRRETYGASGFVKDGDTHSSYESVNGGIWCTELDPNTLMMNLNEGSEINADGIQLYVGNVDSTSARCNIKLPEAPDGLTSSVDGSRFSTLADAVAAGGSELTQSVTNRKDLVFLEVWDELISDKDVVFPFGNVQYGDSTYEGIALSNSVTTQGYSAFYADDTSTQGYGVVWSTLSEDDKEVFLSEPKNNIRNTKDGLVQRRYRVRSVAGLQGDWSNVTPDVTTAVGLQHDSVQHVIAQGSSDTTVGLDDFTGKNIFLNKHHSWVSNFDVSDGAFLAVKGNGVATDRAYNGFCVALPIALVPRLNKGAYHPRWNSLGTAYSTDGVDLTNRAFWYQQPPTSLSDAFARACTSSNANGAIGTTAASNVWPRPDGKFYDAIYAFGIQDLRLNLGMGLERIDNLYKRMKRDGRAAMRNMDMLPLTKVRFTNEVGHNENTNTGSPLLRKLCTLTDNTLIAENKGSSSSSEIVGYVITDAGIVSPVTYVFTGSGNTQIYCLHSVWESFGSPVMNTSTSFSYISQEQTDIPAHSWTDIIGSPERIVATFPDGVYGRWVPVIPDGTTTQFEMNKKVYPNALDTVVRTTDDGATFVVVTDAFNSFFTSVANEINNPLPTGYVALLNYEYVPDFSTPSDLKRVDYSDFKLFTSNSYDIKSGNSLVSTLIGEVAVNANSHPYSAQGYEVKGYFIDYNTNLLSVHPSYVPTHDIINLASVDSPAVKELGYTHVPDSGLVQACGLFKQLKFDSGADRDDILVIHVDSPAGQTIPTGGLVKIFGLNNSSFNGKVLQRTGGTVSSNWTPSATTFEELHIVDGKILWVTDEGEYTEWVLWDGNGFGDDNKFQPANGLNYVTDYNGNTVKSGHVDFDMGIRHYVPLSKVGA